MDGLHGLQRQVSLGALLDAVECWLAVFEDARARCTTTSGSTEPAEALRELLDRCDELNPLVLDMMIVHLQSAVVALRTPPADAHFDERDLDQLERALNVAAIDCRQRADETEAVVGGHWRVGELRDEATVYDGLRERIERRDLRYGLAPAP